MTQYMMRRAKDWSDRGFTETVVNFHMLNERSKFWGDDQRAAFKNWEEVRDVRNQITSRQGIPEMVQRRELLNRVIVKVLQDNKLDILVQLHSALPPGKIGLAPEPEVNDRSPWYSFGPAAGITEILIPAGYVPHRIRPDVRAGYGCQRAQILHEQNRYTPLALPAPGLPFSINFLAEPGMEHLSLKAASAYQAASKRRVPPPMTPALEGEP